MLEYITYITLMAFETAGASTSGAEAKVTTFAVAAFMAAM